MVHLSVVAHVFGLFSSSCYIDFVVSKATPRPSIKYHNVLSSVSYGVTGVSGESPIVEKKGGIHMIITLPPIATF